MSQCEAESGSQQSQLDSNQISTIYLDEHIRAIHKPCNLTFHSDNNEQGVVAKIRARYPAETLYPVHRLDRMTSGLMIFARSQQSNKALSTLLAAKQIEKYYLALTSRKPTKKQGGIIGDMEKGRRGSYLLLRSKSKPAITRFFVKPLMGHTPKLWLYLLKPETGKTHQLRVAMKSIGCAIYGDRRYGQDAADRGYLHAYRMRFDLFGKRYDLVDELFTGQYFNFQNETESVETFIRPETLAWPKRSFLLRPEG